ncbi:MAG TPA: family 16 glycoside hydrolase [Ktedonobacteraceae bacterium]|nr:family 16 glycoside hydrolase [Ktedonobacteraceae bacterium]
MSDLMYPGPRHRIYSSSQLLVLTIVVLLIIVSSGVMFFSAVNYQISANNASSQAVASAIARATSIAQANASATALASTIHNPYPPYTGNLVLNDPLNGNNQGNSWDVASTQANNACQFAGSAYESANNNPSKNLYSGNACFAENTSFANFTFQVQTTLVQGLCGGIVFRGDSKANNFDRFEICSNSWYDFRQCSGGYCDVVFANGLSPVIHTKYGATNTLAVVANDAAITIYVNGKQIISATASGFSQGQIGFVTSGYDSTRTVATFRNAQVWAM